MTAYYNENDPFAAGWLRNLIAEGLIAHGHVDDRSIADVAPGDLDGFDQHHFFAGIGGWSCALRLAGWPDTRPVWTGSCPCQPFSLAGAQKGFADARHLWPVWRNLIAQRRPAIVFGEQVASATAWLGLVRGDLEALDYAVGAVPVEAASAGAYHLRDRCWFVADRERGAGYGGSVQPQRQAQGRAAADRFGTIELADAVGPRLAQRAGNGSIPHEALGAPARQDAVDARNLRVAGDGDVADGAGQRQQGGEDTAGSRGEYGPEDRGAGWVVGADGKARRVKPGVRLLAHGVPSRVGKLRGFGNAIDPRPARAFIEAWLGGYQ